jgi:hypothetical protein
MTGSEGLRDLEMPMKGGCPLDALQPIQGQTLGLQTEGLKFLLKDTRGESAFKIQTTLEFKARGNGGNAEGWGGLKNTEGKPCFRAHP